jgi:predicted enzyme related to lactoylglutathione lyase
MSTPVVWFEVMGQHGDNLQGFYQELLGWRFDPRLRVPGSLGPRPARRPLAFRRSGAAPAKPPWWVTFYTRVPDLAAAIEKARSLGSQVLVPPTQHGDTVIAVVSDPAGHPVGLCT